MNEKIQVVKADIEAEQAQIAQIFEKLSVYPKSPKDPEQVIIVGYYLHNLYTAFEHLSTLLQIPLRTRSVIEINGIPCFYEGCHRT